MIPDSQQLADYFPVGQDRHGAAGGVDELGLGGVDAQMVQARLLKDGRDGVADGVTDYA